MEFLFTGMLVHVLNQKVCRYPMAMGGSHHQKKLPAKQLILGTHLSCGPDSY